MTLPLEGVRVVDCSAYLAGGFMSRELADLGADIIKVERPTGDPVRGYLQVFGVSLLLPDGGSALWEMANRNKRSIVVDLSKPKGVEVIHHLAKTADVFLTNTRMESLKKTKLDYETLSGLNPDLIYAWEGGFGLKGAEKDRPAIEPVALAKTGSMLMMGHPEGGPTYSINAMADRMVGLMSSYAIMVALFAREKQGVGGQFVDISMIGSMNDLNVFGLELTSMTGSPLPRQAREEANNPLYNWYKCKDGVYIVISLLEGNRYWPGLCRALEITEIENDPRFSDENKRQDNKHELIAILDRAFGARDYAEWDARLIAEDLLFARVNEFKDVLTDPQFVENGYVVDYDHPKLGKVKLIPPCFHLSKTPGSIRTPAPELGQHTEEVLLEYGFTWEEIAELKDQYVIN